MVEGCTMPCSTPSSNWRIRAGSPMKASTQWSRISGVSVFHLLRKNCPTAGPSARASVCTATRCTTAGSAGATSARSGSV
jgi:hypothetical protein